MADKKISALTAATTPLAGTEVLPIVQSGATVKVVVDDLTVENIRSNATTGILQVAGPAAASTRVMTVPDANFTAARTDAAQTFTGTQTFTTVTTQTLNLNDAFGTTLGVLAGSGSTLNNPLVMKLAVSNASQSFSIQDQFGTVAISAFRGNQSFGFGVNAADSFFALQKDGNTNRSINAAGTINASGADYAEYMEKAGDFVINKGDICGIDSNGKLTNKFSDSVSFVVKSTNPSYVGGDTWGSEAIIGKRPQDPVRKQPVLNNDTVVEAGDSDEEWAAKLEAHASELAIWLQQLELERQKVDRIAFAGQVPVNVTNALAGQYIVPIKTTLDGIDARAVTKPTFDEYQIAVGKVIAIESDGKARVIVKVV